MSTVTIITALKSQIDSINKASYGSDEWWERLSDLTDIRPDWLADKLCIAVWFPMKLFDDYGIQHLHHRKVLGKEWDHRVVWHVPNTRFVRGEDITGNFCQITRQNKVGKP